MILDTEKLSISILQAIVVVFKPEAACLAERILVVGGSPRSEYRIVETLKEEKPKSIAEIAPSVSKAWQYAAERLLKENNCV